MKRQLFLDSDGVMADFDKLASEILGFHPRVFEKEFGAGQLWKRLSSYPDFFYDLDPCEGAFEFYETVKHLKPIILTGLPQGNWALNQKLRWYSKYFPDINVICCMSREKIKYAKAGDVIVDDWAKYQSLWNDMGGHFILHTSFETSLDELKNYFEGL